MYRPVYLNSTKYFLFSITYISINSLWIYLLLLLFVCYFIYCLLIKKSHLKLVRKYFFANFFWICSKKHLFPLNRTFEFTHLLKGPYGKKDNERVILNCLTWTMKMDFFLIITTQLDCKHLNIRITQAI